MDFSSNLFYNRNLHIAIRKHALLIYSVLCLLQFYSCRTGQLSGQKLYLLSLTIENDIPKMKEMELNFVESNKVEVRLTLFAYMNVLKTAKNDSTIYGEYKIYEYSIKDGYLNIPDLHLITKLTRSDNGDYETNTREFFYHNSIIEILNTQEAQDRIIKTSPFSKINNMYLAMLHNKPEGDRVDIKDEKVYFKSADNNNYVTSDTIKTDVVQTEEHNEIDNDTESNSINNSDSTSLSKENYMVITDKAYFYSAPIATSRRKAYLVRGEKIGALQEENGFVHCSFTNKVTGKTSQGWILKQCLE